MTTKVAKLQRACLMDPVKVEVAQKYSTVDTLRQQYLFVPAKYKVCSWFNGHSPACDPLQANPDLFSLVLSNSLHSSGWVHFREAFSAIFAECTQGVVYICWAFLLPPPRLEYQPL